MRINPVLIFVFILGFSVFLAAQNTESKEKPNNYREALVIGNSDYQEISKLESAKKDARNIAKVLEKLGFKVIFVSDATNNKFYEALREWDIVLKRSGGVALFYYTGHGIQTNGVNYLIPVDASISRENEIVDRGIKADLVLRTMKDAQCKTNIVIFDACRANPFGKFKIYEEGFAEMQGWPGAVIAYSTIPGRTARDSESYSSFFYYQLLNNPHLEIRDIFDNVRDFVIRNTGGKQLPYETYLLGSKFYFEAVGKSPPPGPFCRELNNESVRNIIVENSFFETCWNPYKKFKNRFRKLKRRDTIVITDGQTNLMWLQSGSIPMTYKNAVSWRDELNKDESSSSYHDWRLPNIKEAASLLGKYKDNELYIDPKFSPLQRKMWTCDKAPTEILGDRIVSAYWAVDFERGVVARFDEDNLLSVRLVRFNR